LSKIDSGFYKLNLRNENIVEIVKNIVESVEVYIKGKGLNIVFDSKLKEKVIACDPEKFDRLMLNLISNAIKFTNRDGYIYINIDEKDGFVSISVRDTGVGIDRKSFKAIFRRFHQVNKTLSRNTEGSGIGLSLVKSIVEMHNGRIHVDSEIGKGSVFTVELPVKTVENSKDNVLCKPVNNRVEMINIEFSDIYN
jgi:methyl-accepting chemotaxis protein